MSAHCNKTDTQYQQRRGLFPGLYEETESMLSLMERYAVESPKDLGPRTESSEPIKSSGRDEKQQETVISTRHTQADIWGRISLKEPDYSVDCAVCQRPVNTLRYAQHLDKCLGIGTMARSASSAGTR